jgi:hypothetical protein
VSRLTIMSIFMLSFAGSLQQVPLNSAPTSTVHLVVFAPTGDRLDGIQVDSFIGVGSGKDFKSEFRGDFAKGIPFGDYELAASRVGFRTTRKSVRIYDSDSWVELGLISGQVDNFVGVELSGTVNNIPSDREPAFVRIIGIFTDRELTAKLNPRGHNATFKVAGEIPLGKYLIITIARDRVLDVSRLDLPTSKPIVINLGRGN